ncbi:TonB-dependent receptor [Pseudidiomarina sediminum]|uniref:TonB-dependent receptor n=1 Tax=Pseudidiomarina sediminum TaxID=431675 RepID=UPI0013004B57|nr:TonB-dependent receptor [Pseudidiomarina sediminum]
MNLVTKKTYLATVLASLFSLNAMAQDTAATNTDQEVDEQQNNAAIEEVVTTGQLTQSNKAMAEQFESASVMTTMSVETMLNMPQENLANILGRLPGLAASADQSRNQAGTGEAQYLSIRGLDNSFNAFTMNGVRVAQTDATTRAVSLNLFSPFSIASVAVDKAPSAQYDGDNIAGIIDFRTPTAEDFGGEVLRVRTQGTLAGRANERGQDDDGFAIQGEMAKTFGRFGVYGNLYYSEKNTLGESTALQQSWLKQNNLGDADVPKRDDMTNLAPRNGVQWNFLRNNIERQGATLSFDYQGDAHKLYLRSTYGEYALKSWMDQASLRAELDGGLGQVNPIDGTSSGTVYDDFGNLSLWGMRSGAYHRTEHSDQSLLTVKIGGESIINDALTMDYYAAYSDGQQDYPLRIQTAFYSPTYNGTADGTGPATEQLIINALDPNNPRLVLTPGQQAFANDLNNPKQWYITGGYEESEEQKLQYGTNFNWQLDGDALKAVKFGVMYEDADRLSNSVDLGGDDRAYMLGGDYLAYSRDGQPIGQQGLSLAEFEGTFIDDFMGGPAQMPFFIPDTGMIEAQYYGIVAPIIEELRALRDSDGILSPRVWGGYVDGQESRLGAYVMAEMELGGWKLYPGLRYEDNSFDAVYTQEQQLGDESSLAFEETSRSYDQWMPSLIANYRPDDNTVYRASVRKSYSRPSFDLLLGPSKVSRNDKNEVVAITVGNPNLSPVEAWNFDANAEFISNQGDFFSVSVYYKDLQNVIQATGQTNSPVLDGVSEVTEVGEDGVAITRLDNSASGKVYGIELDGQYTFSSLPGALSGLGVYGNITRQKTSTDVGSGEDKRESWLTQAPELMYTAEVNYRNYDLFAALTYSYTGKRLYRPNSTDPDLWMHSVSSLDLSVSYNINDDLKIGAAVENLLDSHNFWTYYGNEQYLSDDRNGGYVETGRFFTVNMTYTF